MYYKKKNPHGGASEKNIIDFSASVNPLGAPGGVIDAVQKALEEIDRYPDPFAEELLKAIAAYDGVPTDYIICGNGASEIIYSYCAAIKPKRAIEIAPTFAEYEEAVRVNGGEMLCYIYRAEDGFIPSEEFFDFLEKECKRMGGESIDGKSIDGKKPTVFICNPNNPTGKLYSKEFIEKVLIKTKALGTRVFIDECFMDLSDGTWSSKEFLKEYSNLFILKAFTKTFAVPGLRLGYGLCSDDELIKRMSEITPPWNISSVAQAAGIAAVKEPEYIRKTKEIIASERAYLTEELNALGFKTIPSNANFILFFDSADAHHAGFGRLPSGAEEEKEASSADCDLRARLLKRGIAIRDCANFPGLDKGWYRIAIRKPEDNRILIRTLRELYDEDHA